MADVELLPCPWCKDKRVHDYFDDRGCIAYVTCMNHFPRDAKCGRTVTVSISPQHNTPAKAKAEARRRWNEQAGYAHAAEARAERLAEALRWAERHCPCGARPESPDTHPHVPGCLVGAALAQEDRNG